MIVLEAKNVCKQFGGLKAVDNVDLQIREKSIFGIIGPNGAGKSTFFNICTGYYPPTSGTISFMGENITGINPELIAEKGMARTFQNIKLFDNMSVLENIKIGYHMHTKTTLADAILNTRRCREDEKMVTKASLELIDRVGLTKYKDFRAGNLPYGIQRKLEIARSLAMQPKLLLLDEPAAGMNPQETMQLMEFITQLREEGLTIVVIEHDMKFVMNMCDEIMVLNYGQKICQGTPQEVCRDENVIQAYFGSDLQLESEGG